MLKLNVDSKKKIVSIHHQHGRQSGWVLLVLTRCIYCLQYCFALSVALMALPHLKPFSHHFTSINYCLRSLTLCIVLII